MAAWATLWTLLHLSMVSRDTAVGSAAPVVAVVYAAPPAEHETRPAKNTTHSANPHYSFSAGRLRLDRGMAVLKLAAWLQVLLVSGDRGR
jgi:hypothetical protein